MSRDYGLKCLDCDDSFIPENMGGYMIFDALMGVKHLTALWRAVKDVRKVGGLDVDLSAYWCREQFEDFLEWIEKHHEHKLIVVDEYGETHPMK